MSIKNSMIVASLPAGLMEKYYPVMNIEIKKAQTRDMRLGLIFSIRSEIYFCMTPEPAADQAQGIII
ncbi:hypothetical protein ACFL7M_08125 [Thermodesulfobacteriota bacterium]